MLTDMYCEKLELHEGDGSPATGEGYSNCISRTATKLVVEPSQGTVVVMSMGTGVGKLHLDLNDGPRMELVFHG